MAMGYFRNMLQQNYNPLSQAQVRSIYKNNG